MEQSRLLDVILPTFNSRKFLQRRIDSLLNQSFTEWNMIVVDSGSTDGTMEFIKKCIPREKLTCLFHPPGLYASWNYAIKHSQSQFIHIATSDDWEAPEFYETLLANQRASGADIIHCGFQIVNEQEKFIAKSPDDFWPYEIFGFTPGRLYEKDQLKDFFYSWGIAPSIISWNSVLFRRILFQRFGFFSENHRHSGDWYWYLRVCPHVRVWCLDEYLATWRFRKGQATPHYWKVNAWRIEDSIRLEGLFQLDKTPFWERLSPKQKGFLQKAQSSFQKLVKQRNLFFLLHCLQFPDVIIHAITKAVNPFWTPSWFKKNILKRIFQNP